MPEITVHHGDSRAVLKTIADGSVDSCTTDPPYALVSIGKRFGKEGSAPAKSEGATGVYARASSGFMGQQWDTGETAFDPDFWREVYRVLKPGAHLVAFSGTRTVHQMTMAIEAAGFEIRDRLTEIICSETHVTGFMESLDDAQRAAFVRAMEESQFGGQLAWVFGSGFPKSHNVSKGIDKAAGVERPVIAEGKPVKRMIPGADQHKGGWEKNNGREFVPTITSAASAASAAWEGWGTALKPALEPIVLARKPLIGTVAENVQQHGCGALNIDGCRVSFTSSSDEAESKEKNRHADFGSGPRENSVYGVDARDRSQGGNYNPPGRWPANIVHDGSDEVTGAFPAETSKSSGGNGPASQATALGGHVYGDYSGAKLGQNAGGLGDVGTAARFFYTAKADAVDRLGSKHPTVKPIDLMSWLIRLVTPPGGTVLDPFAGTGTTGVAAWFEGFDCILIEREEKYVADINRRIAWAQGHGRLTSLEIASGKGGPGPVTADWMGGAAAE